MAAGAAATDCEGAALVAALGAGELEGACVDGAVVVGAGEDVAGVDDPAAPDLLSPGRRVSTTTIATMAHRRTIPSARVRVVGA
jgi:hypothetical protein